MVTVRDVTERRIAQKKLEALYFEEKQLRSQLQEEIANRSKYTRALVHELNTPLTAILSSSELLDLEVPDGILSSVAKNIRQAALKLKNRTNELVELARGETGMLNMEIEPINISSLIKDIVSKTDKVAARKGLVLKTDLGDIPLVLGDEDRLRTVLENLLDNSIKYTERGQVIIQAKDHDSETLLVKIQDTGCGIDKEQMENLFDPYRRKVTEGQKYSGIGVGLALCRIYIELHGGKIWVESTSNSGTTISFTLPLSKKEQGFTFQSITNKCS